MKSLQERLRTDPRIKIGGLKPVCPGIKPTTKPHPGPKGKVDMNNEQFEVADEHGNKCFVTVIEKFEHHYTKETMRIVRIEPSYMQDADAYTRIINEKTFKNYLKRKVHDVIGYAVFDTGIKEEITLLKRVNVANTIFEFETKTGRYRFNVNIKPYIGLLSEYPVEELEQVPTFEQMDLLKRDWVAATIDHIEVYEEYWK